MHSFALHGVPSAAARRAIAPRLRLGCYRLTTGSRQRAARSRQPPLARSRRWLSRPSVLQVHARRGDEDYDDDYEEDWEDNGTQIGKSGGAFLAQAFRACAIISDKLTDVALQVAPAEAPPGVVRTAVNAGVVLLILAFAKSILGFFLTIGTVIFGAYVSVKMFGLDIGTGSSSSSGGRPGSKGKRPAQKRKRDSRAPQSEWRGLLKAPEKQKDDGLLDVWFGPRKGTAEKRKRQR